ncbi:alpha/beta hydrolase [Spiroplasma turonicum]|uniref:Lysophospholipase n=1 Tax=Spiroplasma turonicum TaxID=216946 RepID=A0A0K1P6R7_9MOLU|nr:alpha/beta hydrolase [Spiroplasma turonicum]AKU79983.1 lysophospholipase [Spiroplasma turonicum]ALX70985.1 lysophospholipase [Spiroplasma turonicum]
MKEIKLNTYDNELIHTYIFDEVVNPKGIFQIIHGSCGHILFYKDFIKYLNSNNYIVIGFDLRGHGKTCNENNKRFFSEIDGWTKIVNDVKTINDYIRINYKGLKIFVLGHSLGSFVLRGFISKYNSLINGCIMTGTGYYGKWFLKHRKKLATHNQIKYGNYHFDEQVWKISYKPLNKKFEKEGNTGLEWLSINKQNISEAINDPLSGGIFTSAAFKDLFTGLLEIQNTKNIKAINNNLPILILSGVEDSVGDFGKGIIKLNNLYKKYNLNTSYKLYKEMRHDILFENNNKLVYKDILSFINGIK